jgi:tripartite-type tricarboxylate transporter receptor subunit TctC
VQRHYLAVFRWLAAAALAAVWGAAAAQTYPAKPIRFLLPFAPGGIGDITARVVAQKMSDNIGQQVVVDNRPGAGMIISANAALQAPADGYTMLLAGNGTAVTTSLFKSLPYDILSDFVQVSTLATFDLVLLVNSDSRFASLADMVAFARSNPGKLNFGTISPGSTQHLSAELFKSVTGISAQTVPFKATPALVIALRSHSVDVAFDFLPAVLSQLRSNSVKALGVASAARFTGLPDLPTIAEGGVGNYLVSSWNAVSVRADTPRPIVDRLNKEIVAAVNSPEVRQKLQELGANARASTVEQTRELMISEIARWKAVIERAKIERQ